MAARRHRQLAADLAALTRARAICPDPLTVAVTGSSGLIGTALTALLTTNGHRVIPLVRRLPRAGERYWRPEDPAAELLDGVDAVIHLAGASIGGRLTAERKHEIRASRILPTRKLAELAAASVGGGRPGLRAFVTASAIGIYGPAAKPAVRGRPRRPARHRQAVAGLDRPRRLARHLPAGGAGSRPVRAGQRGRAGAGAEHRLHPDAGRRAAPPRPAAGPRIRPAAAARRLRRQGNRPGQPVRPARAADPGGASVPPAGTHRRSAAPVRPRHVTRRSIGDYFARSSGFIPLPPKRAPKRHAAAAARR